MIENVNKKIANCKQTKMANYDEILFANCRQANLNINKKTTKIYNNKQNLMENLNKKLYKEHVKL